MLLTLTVMLPQNDVLRAVRKMTGPDRAEVHQSMAEEIGKLTQEHVRRNPGGKTAGRLGATPSGFWDQQAGTVEARGGRDGVDLSMDRKGLSRAFYEGDLKPKAGRLLTFPVAAEAYGKRAREFSGLKWRRFSAEDVAKGKSDQKGLVLGRPSPEPGGIFHALFAGATKAYQPQDRGLLPSDAEWGDAAVQGAAEWLAAEDARA